jgi:hypothetical protein
VNGNIREPCGEGAGGIFVVEAGPGSAPDHATGEEAAACAGREIGRSGRV